MAGVTFRRSSNNLAVLAVGVFAVGTDGFVLNGLLPTIARDLQVSASTAGQLTTVFAATYAIASPLIATFTGNWDRRWVLGGGMVAFVLGMLGQAVGTSFAVVAGARVLAAIGAAAYQSNAFAVAGATASDSQRGRALALVAGGVTVSTVAGVPIGVFASQAIGWRGVMWVIGGIGLLVAVATMALPRVVLPAAGLRDRLGVLTRPPVARTLAVTAFSVLASFSVFVYLPLITAASVHGAMISWVLLASGSGQMVGNWLAGRWTDLVGPGRVRLLGLGGTVAALALIGAAAQSLPATLIVAVFAGGFFGLTFVPQQHRLFTLAPDAPTVALGLNGSAIYVGAGLGSAFGGLTLAVAGVGWLPLVGALVAALALLLAVERAPTSLATTADQARRVPQTQPGR